MQASRSYTGSEGCVHITDMSQSETHKQIMKVMNYDTLNRIKANRTQLKNSHRLKLNWAGNRIFAQFQSTLPTKHLLPKGYKSTLHWKNGASKTMCHLKGWPENTVFTHNVLAKYVKPSWIASLQFSKLSRSKIRLTRSPNYSWRRTTWQLTLSFCFLNMKAFGDQMVSHTKARISMLVSVPWLCRASCPRLGDGFIKVGAGDEAAS